MRQGEITHKTAWEGNPLGGVSAPRPVILPDPAVRFASTAARLAALAQDHPMADWLAFMARLSAAQDKAAAAITPLISEGAGRPHLSQAGAPGFPPLAADGHHRATCWRDGLDIVLADFAADAAEEPSAVATAARALREADPAAPDALADAFLSGAVAADAAGQAVFVAAALQVYFTTVAARFDAAVVPLLPERGLCPVCGSAPSAGVVTASGNAPGVRYLYCSLCSTAWNHVRAVCVTCGKSQHLSLKTIEGGNGAVRAETCDDCGTYAKMFYQADDPALDPYADDLASLGLDLLVSESGWARHAPNPFLLAG